MGAREGRARRVAPPLAALALAACAGGRDVIPESRDVRGPSDAGAHADPGEYEHVARRPLSVVGLAEARGIDAATASRATERLADALEGCVEGLSRAGKLVDGAARVAARIGPDGSPDGLALKTPPGDAVKANALLCFVAPFKLTTFPPAEPDGPPRGVAFEATWGPRLQGVVGLGPDGIASPAR